MGAFDSIKKTIADLPISDIYKARIELAVDQLSEAQRQVSELQTQVGRLESERDHARHERDRADAELQALREKHAEDIRIHRAIEFRRGLRTSGRWLAFCPACHLPAENHDGVFVVECSDRGCKWSTVLDGVSLSQAIRELETQQR